MRPDYSIVLPAYNEEVLLPGTLGAIQTAMAAVDTAVERMERRLTKFKEQLGRKHLSLENRVDKFNDSRSQKSRNSSSPRSAITSSPAIPKRNISSTWARSDSPGTGTRARATSSGTARR